MQIYFFQGFFDPRQSQGKQRTLRPLPAITEINTKEAPLYHPCIPHHFQVTTVKKQGDI